MAPPACWIGGSPCAGKSTVARLLARTTGLSLYHCDEAVARHAARATPEGQPMLYRLAHTSWDEIWAREHEAQVAKEVALYREEFPMILEDLGALSSAAGVIVEGTALLPACVAPLLGEERRALWMVPTEAFQRDHYARRPWVATILAQCADPARAFDAWMARDAAFARIVADDASRRGLTVVWVDGSATVEQTAAEAAHVLGLG